MTPMGEKRKIMKDFGGNSDGKRPLGRRRHRQTVKL
jgi:hypothetical protein